MVKRRILTYCLFISACTYAQSKKQGIDRESLFDNDWLFIKQDITNAHLSDHNDSQWRKLDVPHDWSIEDLPVQIPDSIVGPFSKAAISKNAGGFLVGGTAWYRKHFVLDKTSKTKQVYIQFDGVYMNSDVWINGHHLGNHPNGYTSFIYELTPYLKPPGQSNVIAVQVKNEGHNSRWYSGSGIYRHVWLTTVNPVHIPTWGIKITTPHVTDKVANIAIETNIHNPDRKPFTLVTELYSTSGDLVKRDQKTFTSSYEGIISQTLTIQSPIRWTLENPTLYYAKIKVLQEGKLVDEVNSPFGIRMIRFDVSNGFTLNGKTIKLKGGCIHHDNGPLGAAAIDRAEERKIELLKHHGYNAVRMSHNPPSPYILDVCDRLGMLVIDEAFDMWAQAKTPEDYHLFFNEQCENDLRAMVLRDRNHPSIIMWSIGNEIPEIIDSTGYAISKNLSNKVRQLDSTRAVTMAIPVFVTLGRKNKTWNDTAPTFANLDVGGYNYGYVKYEDDHAKYPDRVMYASEYFPPRGIDNWIRVETLTYVIGTFSWTAMDYLGEAGLGKGRFIPSNSKNPGSDLFLKPSWPIYTAYTGELDLIGNKKVNSYYLDVVWKRSDVELLVHSVIPDGYKESNFYYNFPDQSKSWSFPGQEGKKVQVFVYSRADKVRLELNGKIIGEQKIKPNVIIAQFDAPFEAGTLIAKSFTNGNQTGVDSLTTVGKPTAIRLRADRDKIHPSRNDLSFVSVEVVDAKGNVVPYADDLLITYSIEGDGEIAGVGNGNPEDVSSFQKPEKKVFHGRGLVIVRPKGTTGKARVKATAQGLAESSIEITVK